MIFMGGRLIKTIEESKGKLLTLDIDFGELCTLNFLICFRKNNVLLKMEKACQSNYTMKC